MTPPTTVASESHARMVPFLLESPSIGWSRTTRNYTEGSRGGQLPFAVAVLLRHAPVRSGEPAQEAAARMSDFLTIHEEPAGLRRPIIIMAFSGWNDAAESATTAARYLSQLWSSRPFASIDPETFYHFGLSRPHVRFKPGSRNEREIVWPSTDFSLAQPTQLDRDGRWGVGLEPHLKWRTYCAAVLDLARRSGASLVLTLGALLAEVPHTKPIRLVGGSHDPEMSARVGLRPTRYE